jgi:hypothetical protein
MAISMIVLQPLVALIAGILILLMPRLLNFIVAIYLIILGVTGLWPHILEAGYLQHLLQSATPASH